MIVVRHPATMVFRDHKGVIMSINTDAEAMVFAVEEGVVVMRDQAASPFGDNVGAPKLVVPLHRVLAIYPFHAHEEPDADPAG